MPNPTCAVDGCDNTGKMRRGWCDKHYSRWLEHGDPHKVLPRGGWKPSAVRKECAICRETFLPTGARQKYCTGCKRLAKRSGKHRVLRRARCGWCDKNFQIASDNPNAKGCSIACGMMIAGRSRTYCQIHWFECDKCGEWEARRGNHECTYVAPVPIAFCKECGKVIQPSSRAKAYCSPECKYVASKGGSRNIWVKDCAWCKTVFVARLGHYRYCSSRCSRQATRGPERFVVPDTVRFAIYERDRWVCQLCGKKVGRSYPPNHRRSPSLDHIIPRSLGGSDEPDNLQLSHRDCNSLKSDGTFAAAEQLPLVGLVGA